MEYVFETQLLENKLLSYDKAFKLQCWTQHLAYSIFVGFNWTHRAGFVIVVESYETEIYDPFLRRKELEILAPFFPGLS